MQDSWPSAEHEAERASPLPRVEDLPYAESGYEPERVREAFDAFYRHIARLDATLRTIEAVDVFRDQAGELRKELRALRTAGWTQQPWLPSYSTREPARPGVPEAVIRWALEAAFVIAVPVAASVADLRSLWIIAAAAGAFLIVAVTEWAASRERDVLSAPLPAPAAPPAPAEEPEPVALPPAVGEATEWTVPPQSEEPEPQQEELTVVAGAVEVVEVVAEEPAPAPEPEEEPEPQPQQEELAVVAEAVEVVEVVPEEPALAPEPEEPEPQPQQEELAVVAEAVEVVEVVVEEPAPVPEPEEAAEAPPRRGLFRRREVAEAEIVLPEPEPEAVPEPPAVAEEPPRRRWWQRERPAEEGAAPEVDDDRPKHVRVLPAEAESRAEPLDPWEEELDVEPEAEHEATPRG